MGHGHEKTISKTTRMQKSPPTIGLSDFFMTRYQAGPQTMEPEEILRQVRGNFGQAQPGYRDGVCLVPLSPEGLLSTVVNLVEGESVKAEYVARVIGELPRKFFFVEKDSLPPCQRADVVLYRADVLAEGGERSTSAEWEIISLLAHEGDIPLPLDPATLIANHFKFSGGTQTGMAPEEFICSLETSSRFWSGRAEARISK
jgi:hypothetical protein